MIGKLLEENDCGLDVLSQNLMGLRKTINDFRIAGYLAEIRTEYESRIYRSANPCGAAFLSLLYIYIYKIRTRSFNVKVGAAGRFDVQKF
jgi:hypothetical protein